MKHPRREPTRAHIVIDVYDQPLLTVFIWGRRSADQLTSDLWEHGILAHVVHVEIDPNLNR
jgi:hypothetical protein